MKIYDCFTFYNEFELLELRLKSLWDMVDYFVLVEADKTQNNEPKPFYFAEHKNEFAEFLPKIRHIPLAINIDYKGKGDWQIENGQRNGIMHGLTDSYPEDFILISDLDEIPSPNIIQRMKENNVQVISICPIPPPLENGKVLNMPCQILVPSMTLLEYFPLALQQSPHFYYMDYIRLDEPWNGTVITKRKNLTTPQMIREMGHFYKIPFILNGGYHFTYMGGIKRVVRKIASLVEGDVNIALDEERKKKATEEALKSMEEGYFANSKLHKYDIKNIKLPHLQEFLKKYPYFLRAYDFGEKN